MKTNSTKLIIICLYIFSSFYSSIYGKTIDWSILMADDTLTMFLKGMDVGSLYSKTSIDSGNKIIEVSMRLMISADDAAAGNFSGMVMEDKFKYGFDGMLVSALQKLKSQSGMTTWYLERGKSEKWNLTVTAGGIKNTRTVDNVKGNLAVTHAIQNAILNKKITVGQEWKDTLFDLTAARNNAISTKCIAVPDKKNSHYVFINHNELAGIEDRLEIDTNGRIVLQEIPPIFMAKRYGLDDKNEKAVPGKKTRLHEISGLFTIPLDRAQKDSEKIALGLKSGIKVHKSVGMLYSLQKGKYILQKLPKECYDRKLPGKMAGKDSWLFSTVTIQSDHPEIQQLAKKLKGTLKNRCEIINHFNKYVYENIEKKNVATFSNAYETLKAGFGDCGEHAVLLAALLRAAGIESNVVLGVVYIPSNKGYYYHAWVAAYTEELVFTDPALGKFPASNGYVPLVIDDDGTNMVYLGGLIGRIDISYVSKK